MGKLPLLRDVFPELAAEVTQLLRAQNELELAEQVADLSIHDRCRCGDDFCATIYTLAPPQGAYGPNHYSLDLDPERGMIILDVNEGKIACIEALNRNEVRRHLLRLLP